MEAVEGGLDGGPNGVRLGDSARQGCGVTGGGAPEGAVREGSEGGIGRLERAVNTGKHNAEEAAGPRTALRGAGVVSRGDIETSRSNHILDEDDGLCGKG